MVGIAIIGMTTAARGLLDAATTARVDEAAAAEQLHDAIDVACEAYRALTGNYAEPGIAAEL